MSFLIYTYNNRLYRSLNRYINYVKNINNELVFSKKYYLFWDGIQPIKDEVLESSGDYKEFIIVPLVYLNNNSKKQCINLLDFQNLSTNIRYAVKNYSQYALLYLKKVQGKLKDFFKGHGQEAIFSVLNNAQLGFNNGLNPSLKQEYKHKRLVDKFLKPGLKNWKLFIVRFKKYEDFLYVCGFRDEINKINKLIFVTKPNMKYIEQNQIEKAVGEREKIVNSLEKIDELLMKMKNKIESYNET